MIPATCPNCNALFSLGDELAGKPVRCEKCETVFAVPMPLSVDAPAPAASQPPAAPASPANPPAAALPPPTPAPQPASTRYAIAALVCFFVGMLGTGTVAAFWIAAHLAPPSAHPHRLVNDAKARLERKMDRRKGFADGGDFRDRRHFDEKWDDFGDKNFRLVESTPLPLAPDGRASVNDRLQPLQPWHGGTHAQDGPVRLFRVTLEQDRRYNFVVDARKFAPRIRIYLANDNDPTVSGEERLGTDRCFVSFQPHRTDQYVIQVTRTDGFGEDFDLRFAPVTRAEPERLADPPVAVPGKLEVQHPLDVAAPDYGPYREYVVALEAGADYEFKLANTSFNSVLRIYDNKGLVKDSSAAKNLTVFFHAKRAADYRIRVTSTHKGMGDYTLHVTRRNP